MRFERSKIGLGLSTDATMLEQERSLFFSRSWLRRHCHSNLQLFPTFNNEVVLLHLRGLSRRKAELTEEHKLEQDLAVLCMSSGGSSVSKRGGQTERASITTRDMMSKGQALVLSLRPSLLPLLCV